MFLYDMLPNNRQLLLDAQMREYSGAAAASIYDHSRSHIPLLLHGATITWAANANGLNYMDFEALTPDWLDASGVATAALNFTTGAFTLATWLNLESVGFRYLMDRGLEDADGWSWAIDTDSVLWLETSQAGAHQHSMSAVGSIPLATWTLVVAVRNGAAVTFYVNGQLSQGTAATHVNPLTSARELHIGIADSEAAGFFDGILWRPRIWSGALTAAQTASIYRTERGMLGV
jgi:hypothetical protein